MDWGRSGGGGGGGRVRWPQNTISLLDTLFSLLRTSEKRKNKYAGRIPMKTFFKGFLFSVCDVTVWAREVKHWTSVEEKCNIKVRIS